MSWFHIQFHAYSFKHILTYMYVRGYRNSSVKKVRINKQPGRFLIQVLLTQYCYSHRIFKVDSCWMATCNQTYKLLILNFAHMTTSHSSDKMALERKLWKILGSFAQKPRLWAFPATALGCIQRVPKTWYAKYGNIGTFFRMWTHESSILQSRFFERTGCHCSANGSIHVLLQYLKS